MRTVRWGTPAEVAGYEFGGSRRYTEQELRDLASAGRIKTNGGDPLQVGYVWIDEAGRSYYDLDWTPEPPTMISSADDDPRQWPIEPPPPNRQSGGGGNNPAVGPT